MKYNHMFDVAFSLDTDVENPYEVPKEELLEALAKRLAFLRANPEECAEAFGFSDSYTIDERKEVIDEMEAMYEEEKE
jgi:hypothetical protein